MTDREVEAVADAIQAVMPERFGPPEHLADPARTARWNKSQRTAAVTYARAAIAALDAVRKENT